MKKFLKLISNYPIWFLINSGLAEIKRKVWREWWLNSYSQNYEDIIIDKFFNVTKGRYLEIGAYHPTRLSNTYRLYKKGWTGVVIEPNPEIKDMFEKSRPKDTLFNIGISEKGGRLKYYKYLIPALNGFSKINKGHIVDSWVNIETKKITDVVRENFDFVSIDTEGYDKIILRSWPWDKYRPKLICVEDGSIKMRGYRLIAKTKNNSIYALID